jgi:hypothetical protein
MADWVAEVADEIERTGEASSVAIDASGQPCIAYYAAATRDLKYAVKSGGTWTISTVVSTGSVGDSPSLAFDSSGNPHIAFVDGTNDKIKLASWNGASWDITDVVSGNDNEFNVCLDFDSSDTPHILFFGAVSPYYPYMAKYNGASWDAVQIDSDNGGEMGGIVIDDTDRVHVCYTYFTDDPTKHGIKYAYSDGGAWTVQILASNAYSCNCSDIAIDSNNYPHVVYSWFPSGGSAFQTRYQYWNGSTWSAAQTISEDGVVCRIAIDNEDTVHVVFAGDDGQETLYYSVLDGTWSTSTLDTDNYCTAYHPIGFAWADGALHVSYQGYDLWSQKYATASAGTGETTPPLWQPSALGHMLHHSEGIGVP